MRGSMRRAFLLSLIVLAAACGRESKQSSTATTGTTEAPPERPPVAATTPPAPRAHLTPQHCNGDGSYAVAIDCFRQTAGFHFVITEGSTRAEGDMARAAVGAENVRFTLTGSGTNDGKWLGLSKGSTIAWSRDGKAIGTEPPIADTVYQRTTLSFDPQKKEKEAQPAGTEMIDGIDCNHLRFTDANNGDTHDVWISRATGDLVKTKVVPSAQFRPMRQDFTMTLARVGERAAF